LPALRYHLRYLFSCNALATARVFQIFNSGWNQRPTCVPEEQRCTSWAHCKAWKWRERYLKSTSMCI